MPPDRKHHLDRLAVGLLLACSIFWGFQQVLIKATLPELAPVFQAALRFAGAAVLLGLWCVWRGVPLWRGDGSLLPGLLAGLLFAAEFACLYIGLQFTTASRLTVFLYTAPFWVALFVPLFVHTERLSRLQWLGLLFAFLAMAFALREGLAGQVQGAQLGGDLLALAAGMLWGLTTVTIRITRLSSIPAEKLLFYQLAFSAVTLPFLSLALGERWHWDFSPFALTSLLLQTAVGAFASYLAWMWMLGRYPATRVSVFVFLTPVFALLFGALWLHEAITPSLLAALVLVTAGIVLVNRRSVPAQTREAR